MKVICALAPRFELIAACAGRRELLRAPAALAPEPGGGQSVGEVSGAAEAHGVRVGMLLGEALSRCPRLTLVPPDPGRAAERWEEVLRRLEAIGAEVESERPGEAFFRADGLRGIHGGTAGTVAATRAAVGFPARVAAAPARFAAYAAARTARGRRASAAAREAIVEPSRLRDFLAPLPVSLLTPRLEGDERSARSLVADLERLGIRDLGALADLPPAAVSDRFGALGLEALGLARGRDRKPVPRRPHEALAETLELPEAGAGEQLGQALELLVDRLLASPRRERRTIRVLGLEAALSAGGSWNTGLALRRPSASSEVLRLALSAKLATLPGPASSLTLRAPQLGPPAGVQLELGRRPEEQRRRRLGEAVRQVRAAAGAGALLRVLEVDPASRVPERRAVLTPFPDP